MSARHLSRASRSRNAGGGAAFAAVRRLIAGALSVVLLSATLVIGVGVGTATADSNLQLQAETTANILAGERGSVTLTARSLSTLNAFNLSFRYELPVGIRYVGGSTTPSTAGEPQMITITNVLDPGPPEVTESYQVLIWSNVSDLPANDTSAISFRIDPDPEAFPVAATYVGFAGAYADTNPRMIPDFDPLGNVVPGSYTNSDVVTPSPSTNVSAISVTKSEASPEAELMRGIHNHTTVYTITLRNTNQAATNDVTVVDYLPAGMEFLGCGGVDNSAGVEYPGAASLTATPVVASCIAADLVETVVNPAGYPAGVYTRVTWNRGTLNPAEVESIQYRAGVPLRENTATFPLGSNPSSIANLDNNTGALTRQQADGTNYTNAVRATGTYTGPLAAGGSAAVSATDTELIVASDISVVKSVAPARFESGELATFSLNLRISEYTSASDIVLVDTMPDGLCPIVPATVSIDETAAPFPDDCEARLPGTVTNAEITSLAVNADGSYTMTLAPLPALLEENDTLLITYQVLMREAYASLDAPTVSGDSFNNQVELEAVTTPLAATNQGGDEDVTDDSAAGLASTPPSISKLILPRTNVGTGACPTTGYVEDASEDTAFQLGDVMCFQLKVQFSSATDTRNAVVSDFVPVGTEFVGYSVDDSGPNAVPAAQVVCIEEGSESTCDTDSPAWEIGFTQAGSTFVTKGSLLTMYVKARVVEVPEELAEVDITANLLKYRQENTAGQVLSLRTQADFAVSPAPTMDLDKSVIEVNAGTDGLPASSVQVKELDVVTYSLELQNTSSALVGNDFDVQDVEVWDALPPGIICSDVVALSITAGGTCFDGYLGFTGIYAGRSAITWLVADSIAPGSSAPSPLEYQVRIPQGTSVTTQFENVASVIEYRSSTTDGGEARYFPADSLDASNVPNAPSAGASANAEVYLPEVTVGKLATTVIDETNNIGNENPATPTSLRQAVPGERIDYSYWVDVPPGTTVYNGVLSDALPARLAIDGSTTASFTVPASEDPADYSLSATGTLTFPDSYDNTTTDPQRFQVTLTNVVVVATAANGAAINTASFTSNLGSGGTPIAPKTATANVTIVGPAVSAATIRLTKDASPALAAAGQSVTFTLKAWNELGLPPAHDAVLVDCLPAGLALEAASLTNGATSSASTGSDGCAIGQTRIVWSLGSLAPATVVTPGDSQKTIRTFTAVVDPSSAGLVTYTNTAALTASSLSNGENNPLVERVTTVNANANVQVPGAVTTKQVSSATPTVGQVVTYTISVPLAANVNYYNASVIDVLPPNISIVSGTTVVSCVTASSAACSPAVTDTALTPSGTTIGWYLDDLLASAETRTITVTFDARVENVVANTRGTNRDNTANLAWNDSSRTAPTAANASFDRTGTAGTRRLTVNEPLLSIAKTVTDTTPEPGQTITYTVTPSNSNFGNVSAAHNVVITDTVPTGVVVDGGSISNSGVLTSETANGGGTITWTLPGTIARNASVALTYNATLAASSALSGATLTNTARVTSYSSLATGGRTYTPTTVSATSTVTPTFPNVALTKIVISGSTAYADSAFAWRLTAANPVGAGTASTVVITDVLPANWTYNAGSAQVSVAGATATQVEPTVTTSGSQQTLVWPSFGPLAPNTNVVINFSATPSVAARTTPGVGSSNPHVNTLSAVTTDATGATANSARSFTGSNSTASAFIRSADVQVTKATGGAVVAGSTTTNAWTVTVRNNGADEAVGPFTVTDTPSTLPSGVTITAATGTGWTCSTPNATTGAFTCSRSNSADTLAANASFPAISVSVTASASVAASTTVSNTAVIAARTFDPELSNNTSTSELTVSANADLSVTKLVSGAANAGQTVTWTINVSNLGPSVSRGPITVTDTLPSGLSAVTAIGSGWSCGPATTTITCTRSADLTVAAAPQITLSGTLASSFVGDVVNTAQVSGTTTDPFQSNNTSISTTAATTDTTLSIVKSLSDPPLVAGSEATYRFDVTNTGLADARTVTVVDPLPNGLDYAGSFDSIAGTWSCTETAPTPSTVTCSLAGTIAPGSTVSVSIDVDVPSSLAANVINTATADAVNSPPASDSDNSGATGEADLAISKSHPGGTVRAGDEVTFSLGVTNNGPSDSPVPGTGVDPIRIVDTMPTGMQPVRTEGIGWSCTIVAQVVTCDYSEGLASGASAPTLTIVAVIASNAGPATLTNAAQVTGPVTDLVPGNNSANDPVVVTDLADVTIVKTGESTLVAGESTSYEVVVSNDGPSDADTVTLTDTVPVGMTPLSITAGGGAVWACDNPTMTCTIASLAAGESTTFTVAARVNSDVAEGASLTNSATVGWVDSTGSFTGSDSASGTVETLTDLVLAKVPDAPDVTAGTQTSFVLTVQNSGPSDAAAPIEIVDTLPAGLSYVASGDNWTCSPDTIDPQVVSCTLDNGGAGIPAGTGAPELEIFVQIASDTPASTALLNRAVVTSATTELDPESNEAAAEITVDAEADLTILKTYAGTIAVGDPVTFTIRVSNDGPSVAEGVTVSDLVPLSLSTIDISAVDPAWDCSLGAPGLLGTPLDCDLTDPLADGESAADIVYSAIVEPAAYPSVENTATVAATTPEGDPGNNSSTATVPVPALVELVITKTLVDTLVVGQNGRYEIAIENRGPTPQPAGFWIVDDLPDGLAYLSFSGAGVDCAPNGGDTECVFADELGVGQSASVTLTVRVGQAAFPTVTNSVTVFTVAQQLDTLAITASATGGVLPPVLSSTGMTPLWPTIWAALAALVLGLVLSFVSARRRAVRSR